MKRILYSIITMLLTYNTFAQAPAIQWQKCLGGTLTDQANSIQQTNDGGYITAGYVQSNDGDVSGNHGTYDFWVVKLNNTGTIQWQKCLGGSNSSSVYNDQSNSIQQTTDGGYIVTGETNSNNGDVSGNHLYNSDPTQDVWLVKLNSTGTIQWQKCLGGSSSDGAYSVRQTSDNGYVVAGVTNSTDGDVSGIHNWTNDAWIVKLNSTGTIQWQKCLGGNDYENARSIQQTTDGGYIITGDTKSNDGDASGNHGNMDAWVVKLNSSGTVQWQKCLGGSARDRAHSIQQTSDGGYILSGETSSKDGDVSGYHDNNGNTDAWVVKLNSTGDIQWQKCLGGTGSEVAYSIKQINNGSYILSGTTGSSDGDVSGFHNYIDAWVVKLNSVGTIQWQKCLGGSDYDLSTSIQQTTDGGYILAGGTSTNNNGDVSGNHGSSDYWIVKLAPDITTGLEEKQNYTKITIFPNPAQTQLQFSEKLKIIQVYDLIGNLLMIESESDNISIKSLNSGIYLLKATTVRGDIETKFIKE